MSFVGAALLAGLFALASCSGEASTENSARPSRPAVPVTVASALEKDVPIAVNTIGTVEADAVVSIKSRVTGPIVAVHFQEGQEVKEGDLLFTLDPQPFQVALKQSQAQLAKDQALAANAQREFRRNVSLTEKGVVSHRDYDDLQSKAASLEASVRGDQAAVENARLQLEFSSIRAPISGRTGNIQAPQGTLVKANDDNKNLVTIARIEPVNVTFSVPEKFLGRIRRAMAGGGLAVLVQVPDDPAGAEPVRGRVSFVDNSVDVGTGTILLKARAGNEDRRLWPGQFVQVALILGVDSGVVVVPAEAVQPGQAGQHVFVVKPDSTVELRPVTVPRTTDGEAVVSQGLKAGERVVIDGQLNLISGSQVRMKNESAENLGSEPR